MGDGNWTLGGKEDVGLRRIERSSLPAVLNKLLETFSFAVFHTICARHVPVCVLVRNFICGVEHLLLGANAVSRLSGGEIGPHHGTGRTTTVLLFALLNCGFRSVEA